MKRPDAIGPAFGVRLIPDLVLIVKPALGLTSLSGSHNLRGDTALFVLADFCLANSF